MVEYMLWFTMTTYVFVLKSFVGKTVKVYLHYPLQYTRTSCLSHINWLCSLEVRALHQNRRTIGVIPAGGPEYFSQCSRIYTPSTHIYQLSKFQLALLILAYSCSILLQTETIVHPVLAKITAFVRKWSMDISVCAREALWVITVKVGMPNQRSLS